MVGGDDPAAQTRQIFKNMKLVLDAAGASFADILKVTVYLLDINDRSKINPVRNEFFGKARPASTLIGVRELLPMGSLHLRSGKLKVRVGDPISTAGMTIKDRDELTDRMRREVASLMGVEIIPETPAHPIVSEPQ